VARTALYRFFDAADVLLYVGITDNIAARWNKHANEKRWWSDVARKTVDWHDSRTDAELIEKRAILDERPLYNVVHVPGPRARRPIGPPPAAPLYARITLELRNRSKTKSWLSGESGVARTTIDKWETQPRMPQAGTVAAVADALSIDRLEAARLAGLPVEALASAPGVDLSQVEDEDLLAELLRRLKR
jgi:transcriptional regulator with XRE-family HTH domain